MQITIRKVTNLHGQDVEKRIQMDVPSNYIEVNVRPVQMQGLDFSDSPNVYGVANFKYKGNEDDKSRKIFDFNGYQD